MIVISNYLGKYVFAIDFVKDLLLFLFFIFAFLLTRNKANKEKSIFRQILFYGMLLDIILIVAFHFCEVFLGGYIRVIKILAIGHQLLILTLSFLSLEVFLQAYSNKN
jgi:hypothetical protein